MLGDASGVWALVSALLLTGCVTLATSVPSLGPSLHIYKKSGLGQLLKAPSCSDVLGFFCKERNRRILITVDGAGAGMRGPLTSLSLERSGGSQD